jgi:translocation and assembly module TamB
MTGRLVADLRADGSLDAPALSGTVRLENGKYRMAGFAQVMDDIDGGITFRGGRGDIEARARTGGGDVFVAGNFGMKGLAFADFRFSLQARHVSLRYPQDLRLTVDADLVATSLTGSNVIRGEVVLQKGNYSKDIELTISDLLARARPAGAVLALEPWKWRTALEVRIVSAAALEVRNNLARLTATVDLLVRGSVAAPTLVGQIFLDEGGRITFRDVRYEIEQGTIAFANTEGFEPIIDMRLRAEIKGYDVGVSLAGTWPRIQASLSSDPPLPEETIVGLLLTGATPNSRTTTDTSGQIVGAAGGIVGSAATGVLTRPTQRLFKLDRFEIDPVFTGSGPVDVRSTVGKQITPNLLVTYSQSFDTSKEPIFQLEWWLSDSVVMQARRDENGTYLLDVRRRQRF